MANVYAPFWGRTSRNMGAQLIHIAAALLFMGTSPPQELTPKEVKPFTEAEGQELAEQTRVRLARAEEESKQIEALGCQRNSFSAFQSPWLTRFHWRLVSFGFGPTLGRLGVGWGASSHAQFLSYFDVELRLEHRQAQTRWIATVGIRG